MSSIKVPASSLKRPTYIVRAFRFPEGSISTNDDGTVRSLKGDLGVEIDMVLGTSSHRFSLRQESALELASAIMSTLEAERKKAEVQ